MKKFIFFSLVICFAFGNTCNAQVGGLLKKVKNSLSDEVPGKPVENSTQPEPACACDQAIVILTLGGKLQLDYKELSISMLDDGRILLKTRVTNQYYIVKDGVTQGPYNSDDPKVAEFEPPDDNDKNIENFLSKNKPYISRSGEKFLITFAGKNYGPYAKIDKFTVSKSKNKFAALVTENIVVTEDQGKNMDEAIKNAKTQQEKMDLAMKYTQEMQQKMLQGGGSESITPKLVTNIPNATLDPMKSLGATGNIKYDDILVVDYDKILDLQGKTIMNIKPELAGSEILFVNTSNTKYAVGGYGNLTFSDNTTMSELFNPHLISVNGKIYLAYMYYSPKKNAIMQCKVEF
ncbi:MAG: hypothetical protein WCS03_06985 [Bacteroidota bacterium]